MTKSREPVEEAEEAKEIPDQNMNNSSQVSEDIEIENVRGDCSDSGRTGPCLHSVLCSHLSLSLSCAGLESGCSGGGR